MRKNPVFIVLGVLFVFNILAWIGVFQLNQSLLEVTFFDVGQGDSIFIETPQRHQILIDGGPASAILEKLGKEMSFWDRTIDLVVLTHPEHDHYGGLIEVLKRYKVANILWSGVLKDTAEYQEWQRLIAEEGAEIFIAQTGLRISGGRTSSGRYDLFILHPFESLEGQKVSNINNTSVVAKLVFKENSFLFTGDIEKSVENKLLGKGIDVDVLKAGHHGSKTSSAQEFVEEVSPQIAVISAGRDNSYGHPHQQVLEVLEKYATTILRTDLSGDIKIISNGYGISHFSNQD